MMDRDTVLAKLGAAALVGWIVVLPIVMAVREVRGGKRRRPSRRELEEAYRRYPQTQDTLEAPAVRTREGTRHGRNPDLARLPAARQGR